MGDLRNKKIDYLRSWINPSIPPEPIPNFNYDIIFPRTLYDAILSSDDENTATTLREELRNIYELINNRQGKVNGGTPGTLMTWSGIEGVIGETEIINLINFLNPSKKKLVTEYAVAKELELKTDFKVFNEHNKNEEIHITNEERERWNSAPDNEAVEDHLEDMDIHISEEDRARWDKGVSTDLINSHTTNFNNPHKVTAHQVGTYSRRELDEKISLLTESFFKHKNIKYDEISNTAELVDYDKEFNNPNYILSYGEDLPNPPDTSLRYFALKPVTDYSINEQPTCVIYMKDGSDQWQDVGTVEMNQGDMIIRDPDTTLCVWIHGRFISIKTSSSSEEGEDQVSSNLLWRPVIDSNGMLTFTRSNELHAPDPMNIKGAPGYTPVKDVDYFDGAPGIGIPEGGSQGHILVKTTDEDYDTDWMTFTEYINWYIDNVGELPFLLSDWEKMHNRPTIYDSFGNDQNGLINQSFLTSAFENIDSQIKDIIKIIGNGSIFDDIKKELSDHIDNKDNPHNVTPSKINAVDLDEYNSHLTSENPHNVTKDQVGLSNVDNTSDEEKPISNAMRAALNEINTNINDINKLLRDENIVTNVTWNADQFTIKFTFRDENTPPLNVHIPLIDIFESITWNNDNKSLDITMPNGSMHQISIVGLITDYIGSENNTITITVDGNIIKAEINSGSITSDLLSESIHIPGAPTVDTPSIDDKSNKIINTEYIKNLIIDSIDSDASDRPVSARALKELNESKVDIDQVLDAIEDAGIPLVIDALDSYSKEAALSANMGRYLEKNKATVQDVIEVYENIPFVDVIDSLHSEDMFAALSANMGRQLNLIKADKVHTSPSGTTYGQATVNVFGHTRASNTFPLMDGVASLGADDGRYARSTHRHPTDITRAPLHWPDIEHNILRMTGEFRAETPPVDSNDDRVATTEWIMNHQFSTDKTRAPHHWPDVENKIEKMTGEFRADTPPEDSNDDRVATTEWVLSHSSKKINIMEKEEIKSHVVTIFDEVYAAGKEDYIE